MGGGGVLTAYAPWWPMKSRRPGVLEFSDNCRPTPGPTYVPLYGPRSMACGGLQCPPLSRDDICQLLLFAFISFVVLLILHVQSHYTYVELEKDRGFFGIAHNSGLNGVDC